MGALPYLRSQRKHTTFVVFAALLLWLAVSATHFHLGDDAAPEGAGASCAVCLSLPSAAAPPAALREVVTSAARSWAVTAPSVRAFIGGVTSSYRSRAPPF